MRKKNSIKTICRYLAIISFGILMSNCDSSKLHKTPIENFEGIWELSGRPMFDGIRIKIEKEKPDKLIGRVISLNDNMYVKMFSSPNDIWVTNINRTSNFDFKLTERKIGSELFSIYGLNTSQEFKVVFIDENTIGIGTGNSKPSDSSIKYIRVEN